MMTHGIETVKEHIKRINADPDHSDKEEDLLTTLEVCYEFYLRGFTFDNIDPVSYTHLPENILRVVMGAKLGTVVKEDKSHA